MIVPFHVLGSFELEIIFVKLNCNFITLISTSNIAKNITKYYVLFSNFDKEILCTLNFSICSGTVEFACIALQ